MRKKLDDVLQEKGYSSLSEASRDAVRGFLSEYELSRFEKGTYKKTIDYSRKTRESRHNIPKIKAVSCSADFEGFASF